MARYLEMQQKMMTNDGKLYVIQYIVQSTPFRSNGRMAPCFSR